VILTIPGWSNAVVPGVTTRLGSNGTLSHPLSPIGVVKGRVTVVSSVPVNDSRVVLWPGQLVAFVMNEPLPTRPLKTRRERINGNDSDTFTSK